MNVLYNQYRGWDRLKTTIEGPTFDTSREGKGVPVLDVGASRSANRSEIYLKVVNTDPAAAIPARIDVRGVRVGPEATWHLLTSDGLEARNSFVTPDAIRPRQTTIPAGSSFEVSLPPRSVSVIILRVVGS